LPRGDFLAGQILEISDYGTNDDTQMALPPGACTSVFIAGNIPGRVFAGSPGTLRG